MIYKWKEANLLVSLLASALGGEAVSVPQDTDFENLYALAGLQKVEAMICEGLSKADGVPSEVLKRFQAAYKKEVVAQYIRQTEGNKILNAFEVNGIDCMPLKGWVLQNLYPNPAMRYMCDMDILFKPEQSADVRRVLESLEYLPTELGGNPEVYQKKPVMNIEMHKAIVRDNTGHFDTNWERAVAVKNCEHTFLMTNEDCYIYMIAHLYKHFIGGGTGVRSVCDVELFLRKYGETLDTDYIDTRLENSGFLAFERQVKALCRLWFDKGEADEALIAFSKKMLFSGVFGTAEIAAENAAKHAVQAMPGKSVKSKKLFYLLTLLFPSLSVMRDIYPVLQKAPFLLPVFWVVRGVQRLFGTHKNAKKILSQTDKVTQEDIDNSF